MAKKAEKARMRISRAGTCSDGFTLLELVVVIFILSLLLAVALPSFTGMAGSATKSDAKRIASILRYLNDSAIATKDNFPMKIGISNKMISYKGPDGEKAERFDTISGIELQSRGLVSIGEVEVLFGMSGASEGFRIFLKNDSSSVAVSLNPLSGRVRITQVEG